MFQHSDFHNHISQSLETIKRWLNEDNGIEKRDWEREFVTRQLVIRMIGEKDGLSSVSGSLNSGDSKDEEESKSSHPHDTTRPSIGSGSSKSDEKKEDGSGGSKKVVEEEDKEEEVDPEFESSVQVIYDVISDLCPSSPDSSSSSGRGEEEIKMRKIAKEAVLMSKGDLDKSISYLTNDYGVQILDVKMRVKDMGMKCNRSKVSSSFYII